MVGILESIWEQGVETSYSCQGKWGRHGNPGYILITNALGAAKVFSALDASPELEQDVHGAGMITLEGKAGGEWVLRWYSPTILDRLGLALAHLPQVDEGAAAEFRDWAEAESADGGQPRVWKELGHLRSAARARGPAA